MNSGTHRLTPSLLVTDSRGLPVRQVAYLRTVAGNPVESLVTRQRHDMAGRQVEQRDPRLTTANIATIYNLEGTPLSVASVDARSRLSLPGLAGEILQRWDNRGGHWRMSFDPQLRLIAVEENTRPDVDTYTYADASADAGFNLRGRLLEQVDPSGRLTFDCYALCAETMREIRTFLDGKAFITHRTYSPLAGVLEQIDAGEHRQQFRHDVAGQLNHVQLQLKEQSAWQAVLLDAQYDASRQLVKQLIGNGVTQRWVYDPATLRLQRQSARLGQQPPLQDFEYEYDPMGNITRILDHTFIPTHFANQRVEGHREFIYDSLYRLHRAKGYDDAPPADNPGLPHPTDPNDRRNYTQTYKYDHGGNLTELRHERDGASYTRLMRIDPASNRGVRWSDDDPEPDFDTLFDRHGNLLALQPGQPLLWNSRDELAKVTLVHRDLGPDDAEHYLYSAGKRVYKRLDTDANRHFQEVRYLPGLEIRIKDNGEVLHVITLAVGGMRCLHWAALPPAGIEQDQLRYSFRDHLGSCTMELDQQARMISHEGYYPFGGTAWMATRSLVEVAYKFVRYSGSEMDVSGLYYYGARYYAPWLQRWISVDPAGDVDGLNLYAFVGNNPLRYIDTNGQQKEESSARLAYAAQLNLVSQVNSELKRLNYQLYNLTRTRDIYKTAGKKLAFSAVTFFTTIQAAALGATAGASVGSLTGPAAPVVVPVTSAVGGILAAEATAQLMDKLGQETGLNYSIMPDPAALSIKALQSKANAPVLSISGIANSFNPKTSSGLVKIGIETTARTLGKHFGARYLKQALNISRQMAQLTEALNDQWGQGDLDQIDSQLDKLSALLDSEEVKAQNSFQALDGFGLHETGAEVLALPNADISALSEEMKVARSAIKQSRNLLGRVSAYLQEKNRIAA